MAANNTPFVPPVNPGALAAIPDTSTAAQIASFRYDHKIATDLFTEYDRTDKALRQLLISSVDETFIRALRQKYIGYSTLTTLDFLSHLYKTYANISPSDLQDNDARLRAPYDANHPIEAVSIVTWLPGLATPWTLHQKAEGPHHLQGETGLDITVSFWVFPVPFVWQCSSQLLSCRLFLLLHHPVHREHKWHEVASCLKASLKIFSLLAPLVPRQDFVWVPPIIGCCIFDKNVNIKVTHPTRGPEVEHSHIPMEVSDKSSFLCIGIPPCDLSLSAPPSSGKRSPCCRDPMYFGFAGHCSWGVRRPAYLCPLLVQEIMQETYKPPPLLQCHTCSTVNWSLQPSHVRGGVMEGCIKAPPQGVPEILPG